MKYSSEAKTSLRIWCFKRHKRLEGGREPQARLIALAFAHLERQVVLNADRPAWSVRGLPPFLENLPPTR